MLFDILLGAVISLSFAIGAILYVFTREELDPFMDRLSKNKFIKIIAPLKNVALAPICFLGVAQAVATKLAGKETISIAIFGIGLLIGSFIIADKDNKLVVKYTVETIVTFLMGFFVILALVNIDMFL